MNSFYTENELQQLGFKSIGKNVLISRNASFYGAQNMSIGNNVRIDDFCILSGNIVLGSYIHISAYTALYGAMGIELEDYSGLSPRCTIFSASDDFSGKTLIGPMIDKEFTNVTGGKVTIRKYSQIGAGCIVLPSVEIGEGVAVGAMSLVTKSLESWYIYSGIPCTKLKERSKELLRFVN
ncbi:acyltransferase [uncultured Chryseobacterium sp.]|jgi:Acetyltransferase (isoleucine patch superfamily)|uniref:acyltransferase n=1 Tax=uncultured Chryseobacterium sp. TaxID=259322 RepID=UPI002634C667|nr:acyltransferase [uncultured Chryseobacterium sp.]